MKQSCKLLGLFLFLVAIADALSQSAALLTFHPIGNAPNAAFTVARSVNNRSVVVGTYFPIGGVGYVGYLQSGSSFTTVVPSGAVNSFLMGINDSGVAVGGYCTDFSCNASASEHGFTYNVLTKKITEFNYPQAETKISPSGINNAGQIVGGYCPNSVTCEQTGLSQFGFLLNKGTYTTLAVPGAALTQATAINGSGTIVGAYTLGGFNPYTGFIWQNGSFTNTNILFPGTSTTFPVGIDGAGNIYGLFFDQNGITHGFQYSVAGVYTQIDLPNSESTALNGASSNGNVVGGGNIFSNNQYYSDQFIGTPTAAKPEGK